ncbi:hypothetical protein AYO21_03681 [Fonsecaea monophora]|uniref:Uncharacterized protein n=1 Tax=Fonsecaea monophora TaxID=254056 RepID=A0A177FDX1_9EURO|nr:hypothetical protein AYO21_03681 [Fonsecaea monophora]KAH0847412.1 hypothetical protein FOPE_00610 [Fonsecaea pedrosoi]OAG41946.1 hypothetical protein AYO21_03681 [Fonsecaea monophora]
MYLRRDSARGTEAREASLQLYRAFRIRRFDSHFFPAVAIESTRATKGFLSSNYHTSEYATSLRMRLVNLAMWLGLAQVGMSAASKGFDTFLGSIFDERLDPTIYAPLDHHQISDDLSALCQNSTNGSLLVAARVASIHADEPLFTYSYSTDPKQIVDADTVFRVGSISKLFTVYTILVSQGHSIFTRWIGDLLPEFATSKPPSDTRELPAKWSEVTIGALASHLAGIARDYNLGDLAALPNKPSGLPNIPPSDLPGCANDSHVPTCSRSDFMTTLKQRDAVFETFHTPAYSNNAFRLLGYVVETITNTSYATALQQLVLDPLDLKMTFVRQPPNDVRGAIPGNTTSSGWSQDLGDETPSGGLYSTASDLCSFGLAILSKRQLSSGDTRRWLKPWTHTASLFLSVGAPWEIYRAEVSGRVVDLYCKSGSTGAYNSWLILVPDFGIVISELVAASEPASELPLRLADVVTAHTLRTISSRQAQTRGLLGWYSSANVTNATAGGSTLELTLPSNGPGLEIRNWVSYGVDFLQVANDYSRVSGSGTLKSVRLYPAIIDRGGKELRYRAVFLTESSPESGLSITHSKGIPRLFGQATEAWDDVDQLTYGGQPLDEFIFKVGRESRVASVHVPGLRVTMAKMEV